jgi:hypothetical protein
MRYYKGSERKEKLHMKSKEERLYRNDHTLPRNCLLKYIIEEKIDIRI